MQKRINAKIKYPENIALYCIIATCIVTAVTVNMIELYELYILAARTVHTL